MNKAELMEMRHELLERMTEEFNEALIAAILKEGDENMPESINAILDEVGDPDDEAYGEFFFKPLLSDEDEVQYFCAVITLWDELPEDRLPALYESLAYINFTVPSGCFSIDKDHKYLCYALGMPVSIDMEKEELFRQMDIVCGNAVAIVDDFMGIIGDVIRGDEGPDGIIQLLGGQE